SSYRKKFLPNSWQCVFLPKWSNGYAIHNVKSSIIFVIVNVKSLIYAWCEQKCRVITLSRYFQVMKQTLIGLVQKWMQTIHIANHLNITVQRLWNNSRKCLHFKNKLVFQLRN